MCIFVFFLRVNIMDSANDIVCLQARILDLERDLQHMRDAVDTTRVRIGILQATNDELIKERDNIFYKWTKDDFMDMVDMYLDEYVPEDPEAFKEHFWSIWTTEFNERWSSHKCHEDMMDLLSTLAEDYADVLHPGTDVSKPKKD